MNETQLKEFFDALEKPYTEMQILAGWQNKESFNPSTYFISHSLTSTIFSYAGYEDTATLRNQAEKNKIVHDLLIKSLIEEPDPEQRQIHIFDCGTYDGRRLKEIIDSLPKKILSKINGLYGIDTNTQKLHEATQLFSKTAYPFIPLNQKIEDVDFKGIFGTNTRFRHSNQRQQHYPKKIILGLENIFLNFNGLSFHHDKGLTGFLSSMTNPGDEIILELHNLSDKGNYTNNVESFFLNYFEQSGIKKILGGTLQADYGEYGKFVYITGMKQKASFNGKTYTFPSIERNSNGKKSASPRICIGFSGAVTYDKLFEFLVFNFANNLYVPTNDDIKFSESDMVLKLRNFEHDLWIEDARKKSTNFEYETYSTPARKTKNSGLTAYITLKELYPHNYSRCLYKNSEVIGVNPDAMKSFVYRARYDHKVYPPITKAFPQTSFEKLQFSEKEKLLLDL